MKIFKKAGIFAMALMMVVAFSAPMVFAGEVQANAKENNIKSISYSSLPKVYGHDCLMVVGTAKGTTNTIALRDVGAAWYDLEGVKLGTKFTGTRIDSTEDKATVKNPKFVVKKRNPKYVYKYLVSGISAGDVEGGVAEIESPTIIVAGTKSKYSNPTKLSVNKKKIKVAKGKKLNLKVKVTKKSSKKPLVSKSIRYYSTDKKVVTVGSKGQVKGVRKGQANIFVCAVNGLYKIIPVTVK